MQHAVQMQNSKIIDPLMIAHSVNADERLSLNSRSISATRSSNDLVLLKALVLLGQLVLGQLVLGQFGLPVLGQLVLGQLVLGQSVLAVVLVVESERVDRSDASPRTAALDDRGGIAAAGADAITRVSSRLCECVRLDRIVSE